MLWKNKTTTWVLILILMEYSLTKQGKLTKEEQGDVLILILMEYSLTTNHGCYSADYGGLNPYSNGILTDLSKNHYKMNTVFVVLILILMEYSLTYCGRKSKRWKSGVLILILMEYSLTGFVHTA